MEELVLMMYEFTEKYKDYPGDPNKFLESKMSKGFSIYTVKELMEYKGYRGGLDTIKDYMFHTPNCKLLDGFFSHFCSLYRVVVDKKTYEVNRKGYCESLGKNIREEFPGKNLNFEGIIQQEEKELIKKHFNKLYG